MSLTKVVIPAAGLGTRFLPTTKALPKELLPVGDRPSLHRVLEEIAASGFTEVVFVLSRDKGQILDYFSKDTPIDLELDRKGKSERLAGLRKILGQLKITEVYQDEALGLGHAVGCAKNAVGNEPFAVVLPDDLILSKTPCLAQMRECYERFESPVIALMEVPKEHVSRYGIVATESQLSERAHKVTDLVEKPPVAEAPSSLAIIGRYLLDPIIFEEIENTKRGALGEIQLTDALRAMMQKKGLVGHVFEGTRYDSGQPDGFVEANLAYALEEGLLGDEVLQRMKGLF